MNDTSKEQEIVAKKIESGEYFSEAMSWFHVKFTRPRTEFAYFSIICLIAVAAFCVGLVTFVNIFPLSPAFNFIEGRQVRADEHLKIRSIQDKGETADEAVINYMISEYVRAREEYIDDRLDRNFRIVTALSNDDVYDVYLNETSLSNPQNPVIVYGKQATKEIFIDSTELDDASGKSVKKNPTNAIVNYTVTLTFLGDNTQEITSYRADIAFKYNQITVDQKTGKITQLPKLQVTGYKTKLIQNNPQKS